MLIVIFALLASLIASPSLADDTYRVTEGSHVWTVTPVRVIPKTYSIILALDSRDAIDQRAAARKIAGDYATKNLPGCKIARSVVLGRSGWRVDFACPKSYRR